MQTYSSMDSKTKVEDNPLGLEEKRIGIFEYDWSMYGFIKDLVIKLAESGYNVDVFQKNPSVSLDFSNSDQFNQFENIRFFNFNTSKALLWRILRKFQTILGKINKGYRQNPRIIIDWDILHRSMNIIGRSKYLCFIGIEKKGLIWAGILSRMYPCPLIYYSLELYLEDHPGAKGYFYLRNAEKQYHQRSVATIIQDRLRAEALLKYNQVRNTNLIYFPISVRGSIVKSKSCYFHQKYNLNATRKLILCFGQVQDERFSGDLVKIAGSLRNDITLVLHGFGEQAYLDYLKSIADKDRVILSYDFVAEEKIIDVISSATIGLALYQNTSSNDRLAAFSSVKVAYYLRCGIPIIAFESESFRELMRNYPCGELINAIDEIPQKVEKILNDYDCYQEQAFLAFEKFYNFDENYKNFQGDFDVFIKNGSGVESKKHEMSIGSEVS